MAFCCCILQTINCVDVCGCFCTPKKATTVTCLKFLLSIARGMIGYCLFDYIERYRYRCRCRLFYQQTTSLLPSALLLRLQLLPFPRPTLCLMVSLFSLIAPFPQCLSASYVASYYSLYDTYTRAMRFV
ncbi:hypothetical protein I7I50_03430 [Histoplasma capsulatum G186AR]|uniref:Uncharacterized protein n=1 Tax=Ajellomyces capsulatus TaxID=5037 RepID=A0A8H7YPC9_AJECA|nr:hypothetical protein I7I52_04337 [Histoplasma capsulatum]QSS74579.1 hypothetical protein I7I50_03430 [Histoplasma capsulatum G186AR]